MIVIEFEYLRHGTQALIALFNVASRSSFHILPSGELGVGGAILLVHKLLFLYLIPAGGAVDNPGGQSHLKNGTALRELQPQ